MPFGDGLGKEEGPKLPLLQRTQSAPNYAVFRARKTNRRYTSHRWFKVLAMHMAGKSKEEICAETGYKPSSYYQILRDPEMLTIRQQMLDDVQKDFDALYPKVVDNLRLQLDSDDPKIQLQAQEQFFKATGKYAPKREEGEGKTTAEEIVAKLLNQQINIQVNVGGNQNGES